MSENEAAFCKLNMASGIHVDVRLYICVHTYMYLDVLICLHVCLYTCIFVHISVTPKQPVAICTWLLVSMWTHMTYMCTSVYIHVYSCICIYTYVRTHTYICTNISESATAFRNLFVASGIYVNTHVYVCVYNLHTYVFTCMHMHIHTRIIVHV